MAGSKQGAVDLAFAIAHEIGNHLGGIRLQAHLIDEELDLRSLAEASVSIDRMAGRCGPLLTLLRPLLSEDLRSGSSETWSSLLGRVRQQIEDEGTLGVRVEFKGLAAATFAAPDLEWLYPVLVTLIGATIAHVDRRGSVVIALEPSQDEIAVVIEDDGEEEDLSLTAAYRGRPLAVAIARELIGRTVGRVECSRRPEGSSERTRIRLVFGGSS